MKTKHLKYIYLLLITVFMGSCSLDETIKDRPTPANITTEGDVTGLIHGMYARFNDPQMFKFWGHMMIALSADDIYLLSGAAMAPYGERVYSGATTNNLWDGFYQTILNANNLISVLDRMTLNEDFERRAYGEAYFIRAFSYYYLVRLYGGVPLRIETTTIDSDFYLPRASVAETYEQIFSDFRAASEHLPLRSAVPVSELGRATKGAAQAMLAQAYLTYGDQLLLKGEDGTEYFEQAVIYADSVINSNQYDLLDNYADLFDIAKETQAYNEVIFGIRFETDPTQRAQPSAGSEFALRFNPSNARYVTGRGETGQGASNYAVMHWFADYYRMGDYTDGTVIDYRNEGAFWQSYVGGANDRTFYAYPNAVPAGEANNTTREPWLRKYVDPNGKDDRNHGNDFFVMRMAEVYYIKAEALNELYGPTDDALAAFNKVRERARKADGTPRVVPADLTPTTAGNQVEFRMKIFDDRGLELVGEGQRWFDLVRTPSPLGNSVTMYEYQFIHRFRNQLSAYPTYTTEMPTYDNTTKLWTPRHRVYASTLNVSVPKFLLFPIPTTELIQNTNFGDQNPGWGN